MKIPIRIIIAANRKCRQLYYEMRPGVRDLVSLSRFNAIVSQKLVIAHICMHVQVHRYGKDINISHMVFYDTHSV